MSATHSALLSVDDHWAVSVFGGERLRNATATASRMYVSNNVGNQLRAKGVPASPEQLDEVRRAVLAYEIAAGEGLSHLIRSPSSDESLAHSAEAAAHKAFELKRSLPLSDVPSDRAFEVLQLGALAYCSDRWAEFRAWLRDREIAPETMPDVDGGWDAELLNTLTDVWIRLLRKDGWADLAAVGSSIATLRSLQADMEPDFLDAAQAEQMSKAKAWRLTALYQWAKASEVLAEYLMQGTPASVATQLDFHFERALAAAEASLDAAFEVLLRWLHVLARKMSAGSLWSIATVGPGPRALVSAAAQRGMFELLPPQRIALQEQHLLDPTCGAVVVDLPTSSGKTSLAEFRIVQAINQFDQDGGWVAYVAPTRALVAQLTRRLRRNLSPLNLKIEQLSASIELDDLERNMVDGHQGRFDVLVLTPEKLSLLIRNKVVPRPLALVVLDEAHNIEDSDRGVRIELLLATIKRDCPVAKFLLMMPNVPNGADLARWLAPETGRSISLGTTAWQPNDRLVGLIRVDDPPETKPRNARAWSLRFETLVTSARTLNSAGSFQIGDGAPMDLTHSAVGGNLGSIAGSAACVFSERGTSIVIAQQIPHVWSISGKIANTLPDFEEVDPDIALVQRFLATEVSPEFKLVKLLEKGIGVHHSGLSDEARSLMEWLAEEGKLKVLVATTSIAQGLNFPVSSIFLASRHVSKRMSSAPMPSRSFWNLAGRAGRVDQDSIGVVGLACRSSDVAELTEFVSAATGDLVSQLGTLLDDLAKSGSLANLEQHLHSDQWTDFRSYVAHLFNQHQSLEGVLADAELLLRDTYGYSSLTDSPMDRQKGEALLAATKSYATELAAHPENASLADTTGFSPESVRSAILELNQLPNKLSNDDWAPDSLFSTEQNSALPSLMGVLLKVPQVKQEIEDLTGGKHSDGVRAAEIAAAWVGGKSMKEIAERYFSPDDRDATDALTDACKTIYRSLSMAGTWGITALSKMPTSGIDFDSISEMSRRDINLIGAMMYHGVSTGDGVLMRMAAAPRSVADKLGARFSEWVDRTEGSPSEARRYLRGLAESDWESVRPSSSEMTANDYRRIWALLSGESSR